MTEFNEPMSDTELEAWKGGSTTTATPIVVQPTKFIKTKGDLNGQIDRHELHERFQHYLYLPDLTAVDVAAAALVAHREGGDPLWMLFVSPPSSGKTEILQSLTDCPEVYKLSALTGQTFVSGFKGHNSSLLNRLDDQGRSFLLLKDFTTVLSLHRDARSEILGALREIYDGEYSKDFGNGQSVSWSGRLGFLAGVTPVIDRHHQVLAVLGQRFLMLRLPAEDRNTLTKRAMATRGHEIEMRAELREAMRSFLDGVEARDRELSPEATDEIVAVSRYATQGRTGVERDGYTKEILVVPELEVPARFAKAIAALASGLMAIGYDEPGALDVVARVGRDSMPQVRVLVLEQLSAGAEASTPELANETSLPIATLRLIVEDLTAIGLTRRQGEGSGLRWSLTPDGLNAIKALAIGVNRETRKVGGAYTQTLISPPSPPLVTFSNCERRARCPSLRPRGRPSSWTWGLGPFGSTKRPSAGASSGPSSPR